MTNKTTLQLSDVVKGEYAKATSAIHEVLLKLGSLEADYLSTKSTLLAELELKKNSRTEVLTVAAKDAGVDLENERWVFDPKTLVLTKQ